MELLWISIIFSSIFAPYYYLTRKEQERLAQIERHEQAAYGASPWASTGTYTQAPATLVQSGGSGFPNQFEPPFEPLFEPLSEPPEPDVSHSEPLSEPDISLSEPLSEPDKSYPEPDSSQQEYWTPEATLLLDRIVENGEFSPVTFPVHLVDDPGLKPLVELVLILRVFKETNKSMNYVLSQMQIKKGGSRQFRLVNVIWSIL